MQLRKHVKQIKDFAPHIRAAGVPSTAEPHSAAECLQPKGRVEKTTPKNRTTVNDNAEVVDDRVLEHRRRQRIRNPQLRELLHGNSKKQNGKNLGVFSTEDVNPLLLEVIERREQAYHRREFAPLGKSVCRSNELPETVTSDQTFKFGVATVYGPSAKLLIQPETPSLSEEEQSKLKTMYIKSHHAYAPGEQAHRNYNWTEQQRDAVHGMPSYVHHEQDDSIHDALVWKTAEEKLKDTIAHLPADHSFGLTIPQDEVKAADLIGGRVKAPPKQEILDEKLPVILSPITNLLMNASFPKKVRDDIESKHATGRRKKHDELDQTKALGVPTIRLDIQRPPKKRLCDMQNYGDELDCKELLDHQLTRLKYLQLLDAGISA